jgi:hypothetical protein
MLKMTLRMLPAIRAPLAAIVAAQQAEAEALTGETFAAPSSKRKRKVQHRKPTYLRNALQQAKQR